MRSACLELEADRQTLKPVKHSMGGLVAYLLAGDHPERVSLILEDVAALLPRKRSAPERPEGELPHDREMVLAIRRQIDDGPGFRRRQRLVRASHDWRTGRSPAA